MREFCLLGEDRQINSNFKQDWYNFEIFYRLTKVYQYRTKKQQKPIISYRAEIYVKGVRVSAKTFSTKRSAILWHEEQRHKFTSSPTSLNDRMLFKDCLDKFFSSAKTRIMKNTFQRYELQSVYFYKSPLANVKMSELKGIKIIEWIDWMKNQRTARHQKRKSFIQELKILKTVLNWYKNFLNEDFNVPITEKHKQLSILRPKAPRRPDYFIQPD